MRSKKKTKVVREQAKKQKENGEVSSTNNQWLLEIFYLLIPILISITIGNLTFHNHLILTGVQEHYARALAPLAANLMLMLMAALIVVPPTIENSVLRKLLYGLQLYFAVSLFINLYSGIGYELFDGKVWPLTGYPIASPLKSGIAFVICLFTTPALVVIGARKRLLPFWQAAQSRIRLSLRHKKGSIIIIAGMLMFNVLQVSLVVIFKKSLVFSDWYLYSIKPLTIASYMIAYPYLLFGNPRGVFRNRGVIETALIGVSMSLSLVFSFTDVYKYCGICNDTGVITDAVSCFYFSVVTWTTLGYGDFSPTPDARLFAAGEALIGYLMMGFIIGSMFSAAKSSVAPGDSFPDG